MDLILPHNNWRPRDDQMDLWEYLQGGGLRAVECAHRRFGKDDVALHYAACASQERIGNYWHMLPQFNQCRKAIWEAVNPKTGMRRIDEAFPAEMRKSFRESDMTIKFKNGSSWQLVGSDNYNALVGSPPIGIVFSEYALANPQAWAYLSPILEENNGWAIFISTSRGNNHFKKLVDYARVAAGWFGQILTADDTPVFTPERLEVIKRDMIATFGEEMGLALFMQEYYCFPPGVKIWTSSGQKNIEDISINDVVLTHAGRWRKVRKLFNHQYSGELIEIYSAGSCESIPCTPEHPIRICNPSTQRYQWKSASHIVSGDYVVLPRLKTNNTKIIDPEFIELIAWFIAEGSVQKNAVQFSLNKNEHDFIERIKFLGSKFGKTRSFNNKTAASVQINSCYLADFLTTNCGCGAHNKRIPWHLITGNEELLYKTLIDGDGCRGSYSGITEVFTTISYSLALDVQMLAHIIGKRALINKKPASQQTSLIEGRKVNVSDSYSVRISDSSYKKCGRPKVLPQKHGVAALVKSVCKKRYTGNVYNLAVHFDESYVANGRVVHNCSFEGAALGAYFSKQMSLARKEGRIGNYPYDPALEVDTTWDLGVDDSMSIWFLQHKFGKHVAIDYYENTGYGLEHYWKIMQQKGYRYGNHYMPHDAEAREMTNSEIAQTRKKVAEDLGIKPIIVVSRARKMDIIIMVHIPAVRNILGSCYFDEKKCMAGISALEGYRAEYDEEKKVLTNRPLHDWCSHGSSAFITFAVGYNGVTYKDDLDD